METGAEVPTASLTRHLGWRWGASRWRAGARRWRSGRGRRGARRRRGRRGREGAHRRAGIDGERCHQRQSRRDLLAGVTRDIAFADRCVERPHHEVPGAFGFALGQGDDERSRWGSVHGAASSRRSRDHFRKEGLRRRTGGRSAVLDADRFLFLLRARDTDKGICREHRKGQGSTAQRILTLTDWRYGRNPMSTPTKIWYRSSTA